MSAVEIAASARGVGLRVLNAGTRTMKNRKGVQLMGKSVKDAMTSSLATATPSQSLAEAARMMKQENVGSVPIVDGPRVVGVLTDRDIVVRAVAEGKDPQVMQVGEIASPNLVTVRPDDDLDHALRLMAQHQVRRLPVVEDGHLVGVLAQADVAHEAKEKQVGHVVEEISRPAPS